MKLSGPVHSLPQKVHLGLAGFAGAQRAAAEAALREAAAETLAATDLWTGSDLTGVGFPFELSFTTSDDALRWTFDPAVRLPVGQRRTAVLAALDRLGWEFDPDLMAAALAQAGSQEFGAWLGGRHDAGGDGYKLYLEWRDSPDADAALDTFGLPRPQHLPTLTTPMLGLGPDRNRREVYYRVEPPPEGLINLLAPVGLGHRVADLRETIESSWGHRLRDRLPGGRIGVSYAAADCGAMSTVTIFFFARILWGGDAGIRGRMVEHLTAAGRDPRPYEVATRVIAARNTAETCHGMVALTVTNKGYFWGVGLCPANRP